MELTKIQKFMVEYANYNKEDASEMETAYIIGLSQELGIYNELISYIDFYMN